MINPNKKATTLLLVLPFLLLPFIGSAQYSEMKGGDVLIKTNPLTLFYPLFNGTVEVGIANNFSLELMGGYFPEGNRSSGFYGFLTSMKGGGVVSHIMARHYFVQKYSNFFFSYGIMYKQWEYTNQPVYEDGYFVSQSRKAKVPGMRATCGFQFPLIAKRAVCEMYGGFSIKVRYEELRNRNTTEYGGPIELNRDYNQVVGVSGFLMGIGIGPAFRNKKAR